ncbi:hypothetical protein BT93_K1299 [Corymbia citriodora subsp. variegata]|nr:hypothetical protein BT93_K1299 [Corymbia citriodora subsp. variegata]
MASFLTSFHFERPLSTTSFQTEPFIDGKESMIPQSEIGSEAPISI